MKATERATKQSYTAPKVEALVLEQSLSILASLSAEASIDDWLDDGSIDEL